MVQEIEISIKISMSIDASLKNREIKKLVKKHLAAMIENLSAEKKVDAVNGIDIHDLKDEAELYGNK